MADQNRKWVAREPTAEIVEAMRGAFTAFPSRDECLAMIYRAAFDAAPDHGGVEVRDEDAAAADEALITSLKEVGQIGAAARLETLIAWAYGANGVRWYIDRLTALSAPPLNAEEMRRVLETTRQLVAKCSASGFTNDIDVMALYTNNAAISAVLASAAGVTEEGAER